MRITITREEKMVNIDGYRIEGVDTSSMDQSIHAVQWYEDHGELEIKDISTGKIVENREITSINEFQPVIESYNALKIVIEEAQKAALEQANQSIV